MSKEKNLTAGLISVFLLCLPIAPVFAATAAATNTGSAQIRVATGTAFIIPHPQAEVMGIISGISANTITVFANNTTYAVDASNAVIMSAGKNINISDLKNGDNLVILGPISGANIAATSIFKNAAAAAAQGSSFIGTVKEVNGNSFTFQPREANSVLQTVDAASATMFVMNNTTASASDLAAGQVVVVTGAKDPNNPNMINAAKVQIAVSDNLAKSPVKKAFPNKPAPAKPGFFSRIFSAIGNFFKKIL